jgi:subtilisin family serine protease
LGASSDNNFTTQEPFEAVGLTGNFKLRFVIARTGRGSQAAKKVAWSTNSPDVVTADFLDPAAPSMFGHPTAKGAIAVGAYWFDNGMVTGQFTPELESYSSAGPAFSCCDASGNRLDSLEMRQKPEISAVDGVDTTFFGNLAFVDTSFTFYGTSAAAPHIAGIAALLLEAAGGPGSLTPDQIRSKLIASTGVHDLDPNFSQAVLGDSSTGLKLVAQGGEDFSNLTNKNFFKLQFNSSTPGQTLASLTIDLGNTGLYFNTTRATGFAMAVGSSSDGVQVTSTVPAGTRPSTVTLTFTGLQPGGFVQFGIGRSQRSNAQDGLSADLLGGATVTATLANPAATLTGAFVNKMGAGYGAGDGWGLVDAVKAIQAK